MSHDRLSPGFLLGWGETHPGVASEGDLPFLSLTRPLGAKQKPSHRRSALLLNIECWMLNVGCGEMFRPLVLISAFCFQLSDLMPLISTFNFLLSAFDLVCGPVVP